MKAGMPRRRLAPWILGLLLAPAWLPADAGKAPASPAGVAARALIMPGWGHAANGRPWKGAAVWAAQAGAVVLVLNRMFAEIDSYQAYIAATSPGEAAEKWQVNQADRNWAIASQALAFGFYGWQAYDATREAVRRRRAWRAEWSPVHVALRLEW